MKRFLLDIEIVLLVIFCVCFYMLRDFKSNFNG